MDYQDVVSVWQSGQIRTAADIAYEMNGNGRTGRLLMNYLLLLLDHPPIIIHKEDRRAYYDALEQFDSAQELDALVGFLKAQTVKTWQARFRRGKMEQ